MDFQPYIPSIITPRSPLSSSSSQPEQPAEDPRASILYPLSVSLDLGTLDPAGSTVDLFLVHPYDAKIEQVLVSAVPQILVADEYRLQLSIRVETETQAPFQGEVTTISRLRPGEPESLVVPELPQAGTVFLRVTGKQRTGTALLVTVLQRTSEIF